MQKQLEYLFEKRANHFVSESRDLDFLYPKAEKKKASLAKRSAEIVKVKAAGKTLEEATQDGITTVKYRVHFQYLIKQKGQFYMEEEIEERVGKFYQEDLISDEEMNPFAEQTTFENLPVMVEGGGDERISYEYNRLKAVQYAERWWNSYNPAYKKFEVDCTNFISQCLHEGGAPMNGYPNRSKGWWLRNSNWSYSWSVANALRLYLSNSRVGLRAREVSSPEQLSLGDVICYDFQGDGRFDHNTIVTGKDAFGMPLVNAHTYNSRMRYWAYEDSSAYTPNIKYKFFAIHDGQ